MPRRRDYTDLRPDQRSWSHDECGYDAQLGTMVHRFANMSRVCRCGQQDGHEAFRELDARVRNKLADRQQ